MIFQWNVILILMDWHDASACRITFEQERIIKILNNTEDVDEAAEAVKLASINCKKSCSLYQRLMLFVLIVSEIVICITVLLTVFYWQMVSSRYSTLLVRSIY